MAKSFLEKLNLLLEANLHNMTPSFSFKGLGKGIESELKHLHGQIASSQADEDAYQQHISDLEAQVLELDQQADAALAAGQEAKARYAIEQMETVKRRLIMAQSELSSHRQALYQLMQQVSQLEATVEVAKREAQAQVDAPPSATTIPNEVDQNALTMSEAIRKARESVQKAADQGEVIRVQLDTQSSKHTKESDPVATEIEAQTIDKDISARRSRLAKPD